MNSMQRFKCIECDVRDVAHILNRILEDNEGTYIMDYKIVDSRTIGVNSTWVVVIVELDKKPTTVIEDFVEMGKGLK